MTTTTTRRPADARTRATRAGLYRGLIEMRMSLTNVGDIVWTFIMPLIYVVVLLLMGDSTIPGTTFSLGAMVLPSLVGMSIALGGLAGPAGLIAVEREDGTLLRAKATPHGMTAYLVGKIVFVALTTAFSLIVLVIPGLTVRDELDAGTLRTWLLLLAIFALGMIATTPMGLALGTLLKNSAQSGLIFLASLGAVAISGIFYPITSLPTWLQWLGQALPFYWLGLGARSALLPPEMAAAEIGGSWRTVEMLVVLGAWAVAGLVLAPILLRRMARRESGSAIAARRDRFLSRGY